MTASVEVRASREISHPLVTVSQLGLAIAFSVYLLTEAPEPFSLQDWISIFVPPLAFLLAWWLGRTQRISRRSSLSAIVSRVGDVLTTIGLALTSLMIPISLFGSLMDTGIG